MDLQLKDRVIVVTGGAKGIGAAIVRACANEGAIPVIVNRAGPEGPALQAQVAKAGAQSHYIEAELSDAGACQAIVDETTKRCGRIDGLVNNAGVNDSIGLEKGSPEEYIASLQRNLLHYY